MIDILTIWLIVWMLKTAVEDTAYAVKGAPNPRYELKKQKALSAGKAAPKQARYGSRDWFGDLVSDGLAAQTEKRRAKAAEKSKAAVEAKVKEEQPLDDLAEAVREERPVPSARVRAEEFPEFQRGEQPAHEPDAVDRVMDGIKAARARQRPVGITSCGRCGTESHIDALTPMTNGSDVQMWCAGCMQASKTRSASERKPSTDEPKDTRPDAVIIRFPNPKKIEKEITMATSEVTGLSTALAFAQTAADAHASFATGGSEGYTGALAQHGVGEGCIGSARDAQEASSIAAAKWAKHHEDLSAQLNVKEAYQGTPDAGNKGFLLHG